MVDPSWTPRLTVSQQLSVERHRLSVERNTNVSRKCLLQAPDRSRGLDADGYGLARLTGRDVDVEVELSSRLDQEESKSEVVSDAEVRHGAAEIVEQVCAFVKSLLEEGKPATLSMMIMTLATVSEGQTSRSMLSSEVIVESLRSVAGAIVAAVVVVISNDYRIHE